jgi:2-polyprenyl-3-methyl-5-hydroxy-6-metoxy-1,4-benzoquinol methylase
VIGSADNRDITGPAQQYSFAQFPGATMSSGELALSSYLFDNTWLDARRRLQLLEVALDPGTVRRLTRVGVCKGWHCLEVGAGGGSIATWLSERIGASGRVVATDVETRFLERLSSPIIDIRRTNIVTDAPAKATFDFVHTRWLLVHLREREQVLDSLIEALKPGGWLLVEEPHV